MNHIELVFQFRRVRNKFRFTNIEADLYYELIALWASDNAKENPFQYPNALLCATLGISEKSLIAARNRIKQAGLIHFESGHKRCPSTYEIVAPGKIDLPKVSKSDSTNGSKSDSTNGGRLDGKSSDTIEKKKEKKRKGSVSTTLHIFDGLTAEQVQEWRKFEKWFIEQNFTELVKMKNQLTPIEFLKLLEKHSPGDVAKKIERLDGYADPQKKWSSVYRTVNNWLNDSK